MEKGNTRALLVGMQKGAATLENTMEFPQKIKKKIKKSKQNKKTTGLRSSNFIAGVFTQRIQNY